MLLIIGGQTYSRHGHIRQREPVPYLVNARQNPDGSWGLSLPVETLLFWAWQRWELEVCHRELKSNFGLGEMQAWQPQAALASVQFSAWAYALCLLAAYRTWGLCQHPAAPLTPWWHGSARWSFNTLWRNYRAALWGDCPFHATWSAFLDNPSDNSGFWLAWRATLYASARL